MTPKKHSRFLLALAFGALVAAGPAAAAKAGSKEAPKPAEEAAAPAGQASYGVKLGAFFNDQHKKAARAAFEKRYAKAKDCPEGMERSTTKKCAPPVEGRYWAVGQTLQPAVKPHPVPDAVKAKLPPVPQGYKYVLAGEDILLVSKAIHLVVDMIEDVAG